MKPFEIEMTGDDVNLRLIGEITIAQARELRDTLRTWLCPGRGLSVDAAQLTRLDAAALQVLIAASHAAAAITVVARSDAWDEAFRRYAIEHSRLRSVLSKNQ